MSSDHKKKKKVYFEMMRIIACGLVIFNHLKGYSLYGISHGGTQFFYMCLTMITRINVPLFFMISGALLFSKNEEWTQVFKKRFMRIVFLLLIFDFILMSIFKVKSILGGTEYAFSISKYVHGFLKNNMDSAVPYWYLYCYLGILFVLPLLQRMAKGVTESEIQALLVLHFLTASLFPMINITLIQKQLPTFSFCGDFNVPFAFEKPFFYTIIGYYIENRIDISKLNKTHICGLLISGFVGILLSNWYTYQDAAMNGHYSQEYVQLFDYLTAIGAFILIKYMFVVAFPKLNEGSISKIICFCGSLTLGIYMLDPCLKNILYARYEAWAEPFLPTLIVSIGWIMISMILGGFVTYLLKKIPIMKQII